WQLGRGARIERATDTFQSSEPARLSASPAHRSGTDGIERRLDVGMGALCEHATSTANNTLIFSTV
ncbi:MAG: hypothetical protein WC013_05295, partial [Aeromonas bestiarum]